MRVSLVIHVLRRRRTVRFAAQALPDDVIVYGGIWVYAYCNLAGDFVTVRLVLETRTRRRDISINPSGIGINVR